MTKEVINTGIAFLMACLLKGLTYGIGNFSFAGSSLFSRNFLYDLFILLFYYVLSLFVINKIRSKKEQNKDKK